MMQTIKLYYRYLQRSWGFNNKDAIAMGLVIVVFALAFVYYEHSPGYYAEKAYQRQHAIDFLQRHQWEMLPEDVAKVMAEYNISPNDIISPLNQ